MRMAGLVRVWCFWIVLAPVFGLSAPWWVVAAAAAVLAVDALRAIGEWSRR